MITSETRRYHQRSFSYLRDISYLRIFTHRWHRMPPERPLPSSRGGVNGKKERYELTVETQALEWKKVSFPSQQSWDRRQKLGLFFGDDELLTRTLCVFSWISIHYRAHIRIPPLSLWWCSFRALFALSIVSPSHQNILPFLVKPQHGEQSTWGGNTKPLDFISIQGCSRFEQRDFTLHQSCATSPPAEMSAVSII